MNENMICPFCKFNNTYVSGHFKCDLCKAVLHHDNYSNIVESSIIIQSYPCNNCNVVISLMSKTIMFYPSGLINNHIIMAMPTLTKDYESYKELVKKKITNLMAFA